MKKPLLREELGGEGEEEKMSDPHDFKAIC